MVVADQMRRASKSICANLAEGLGKQSSPQEETRFLRMALGSCEEMKVWVMFAKDLSYISLECAETWNDTYTRISKMLYALIQKRKPS